MTEGAELAQRLEATSLNTDLKDRGNAAYKAKKYAEAEQLYSEALAQDRHSPLLHLNRAAARLALKRWKWAYRDTVTALELLESAQDVALQGKAHFRRAKAEEALRLWEPALDSYKSALALSPDSNEIKKCVKRLEKRVAEATLGSYDWLEVFQRGLDKSPSARLDMADFVGPFEVVHMTERGGGRGVRATRDIAPGELILVEQAFATQHPADVGPFGVDPALHDQIADILARDGSLSGVLLSLYAGPGSPTPMRPPARFECDPMSDTSATVNRSRIAGICTYNCFGENCEAVAGRSFGGSNRLTHLSTTRTSLFVRGSYFNHSCEPNVLWRTYCDTLVIKARKAIQRGEELFVAYTSCEGMPDDKLALAKHFAQGCTCPICEGDKRDGVEQVARRQEILLDRADSLRIMLREQQAPPGIPRSSVVLVKEFIRELESTYSEGRPIGHRRHMTGPYHLLAEAETHHSLQAANEAELKSFEAGGGVIDKTALVSWRPGRPTNRPIVLSAGFQNATFGTMLLLSNAARSVHLQKLLQARQWVQAAKEHDKILMSGGAALWQTRFSDMIAEMGLNQLA